MVRRLVPPAVALAVAMTTGTAAAFPLHAPEETVPSRHVVQALELPTPRPHLQQADSAGGFQWDDAGIGAAAMLGLGALSAGGAAIVVSHRRRDNRSIA
jgi:hypothetical protein